MEALFLPILARAVYLFVALRTEFFLGGKVFGVWGLVFLGLVRGQIRHCLTPSGVVALSGQGILAQGNAQGNVALGIEILPHPVPSLTGRGQGGADGSTNMLCLTAQGGRGMYIHIHIYRASGAFIRHRP
jgi:hypothetical protein